MTLRFIDALDCGRKGFRGFQEIAKMLKISNWESRKILDSLKAIKLRRPDGTVHALIEGQGVSRSVFTVEQIRAVVEKLGKK